MQIEMKVTKRDKKILLFLLILAFLWIFAAFVFLPMAGKIQKEAKWWQEQASKQAENKKKVAMLEAVREQNIKINQDLEIAASNFYPSMTSSQIDQLLTGMILEHQLNSKQLKITMPSEDLSLPPFVGMATRQQANQEEEKTNQLDEAADFNLSGAVPEEAETARTAKKNVFPCLFRAVVQLKISGAKEDMQKLVERLNEQGPSLRITALKWSSETNTYRGPDNTYQTKTENITELMMDIYMYRSAG